MNRGELEIRLESWLETLRNEKSENTFKTHQNGMGKFTGYLDSNGVTEIDRNAVIEYRNLLTNERDNGGIKTSTVNSRLTTLNKFFKDNGLNDLKVPLEKTTVKTYRNDSMTESDYKRLIRWADKLGMEREKMIMKTLVATGVRISELEFFTVESLKKSKNGFTVKNKGKERFICVPDKTRKDLLSYARKNGIESGMIFQSARDSGKMLDKAWIWRNLKKIAGKARVKKTRVHSHSFRRLYAQRFLEDHPEDILTLADLMGHSSLETTRLYTRLSEKDQKRIVNGMIERHG